MSRSAAGQDLGLAWGTEANGISVFGRVDEALDDVDVLVDYTSDQAVLGNALAVIEHGVSVAIGTSGLDEDDFVRIDDAARAAGVGVIAAGNLSLTAETTQAAALLVAPHLPNREIVDLASAGKPDAPSGTAREIAERLAGVRDADVEVPIAETRGSVEARGATVAGTRSTPCGSRASSCRPR